MKINKELSVMSICAIFLWKQKKYIREGLVGQMQAVMIDCSAKRTVY